MYIIGLTGSIGMGKSTVSRMFRTHGIPVQDADAVVHDLLMSGGAGVAPVAKVFPDALMKDPKNLNFGTIDRPTLGKLVFADSEKLAQLETILHPLIEQQRHDFINHQHQKGVEMVVLDIPLLLEKKIPCDFVCVCYADPAVRDKRVLQRPHMTPEKLAAIVAKQMPDNEKKERAHKIIRTDCSLKETEQSVIEIINKFRR